MPEDRLQKIIAAAGIASRRTAEELIAAGRVSVNGRVAVVGERADASTAAIEVDGRPIGPASRQCHLVLHKPLGATSTVRDPHAEVTVVDLVPPNLRGGVRLYPVGRLDVDSEGLLLLTNDGPWADRLMHPRNEVEREYAVGVDRPLSAAELGALAEGVTLDEGIARAVAVRPATVTETRHLLDVLEPAPGRLAWYRVTLVQGWKRQVRRMFGALGVPVRRLVRVRFGTLRLGGLESGACRALSGAEVARLGMASRSRQRRYPPGTTPTRPRPRGAR